MLGAQGSRKIHRGFNMNALVDYPAVTGRIAERAYYKHLDGGDDEFENWCDAVHDELGCMSMNTSKVTRIKKSKSNRGSHNDDY
jgi:hypothetical protein